MNGIQATKTIRKQFPEVRVLVLTTYDTDEWVINAIRKSCQHDLCEVRRHRPDTGSHPRHPCRIS
jgi:DNA-binding NarL/FixJ family response regulator